MALLFSPWLELNIWGSALIFPSHPFFGKTCHFYFQNIFLNQPNFTLSTATRLVWEIIVYLNCSNNFLTGLPAFRLLLPMDITLHFSYISLGLLLLCFLADNWDTWPQLDWEGRYRLSWSPSSQDQAGVIRTSPMQSQLVRSLGDNLGLWLTSEMSCWGWGWSCMTEPLTVGSDTTLGR